MCGKGHWHHLLINVEEHTMLSAVLPLFPERFDPYLLLHLSHLTSVMPLLCKLGTEVGLTAEDCAISLPELTLCFIAIKARNLREGQLECFLKVFFFCSLSFDGLV